MAGREAETPAAAEPGPAAAIAGWRRREALGELGGRLLEAAPGLLTWLFLLFPVAVALIFASQGALAVALFAIAFDAYYLFRSMTVIHGVITSYRRMRRDCALDWLAKCSEPGDFEAAAPLELFHVCLIPTYTEPYHVLERTLQAIADAAYPADRKLVAIITRTTDRAGWENVTRLRERFSDRIAHIYHIKDPLEPGVLPGKSAAMNWGGRWLTRRLWEEGYDPERVLVTDLDSDYRVHPQYFAWISYHHARTPNRDCVIWQPVPLFHNNIWQVPTAIRVMAATISQWQLFLQSRPLRLVAFSSYTCSLKMIHGMGYWDKDVIPEDSRFFWKSFFAYGARFATLPVYVPMYGDAPQSRDYAATHLSQYNQIRRWAWGVTDVPYVLRRLFRHPEIPLRLRLRRFFVLYANHAQWVFLPFFLLFGGSLPVWLSVDFSTTDFGTDGWVYSSVILTLTLSSLLVLVVVEHLMLPPKPAGWPWWRRLIVYPMYLTYPVVGIVLSALPALDAQTRLLMGKYLEYQITEKG